MPEYEEVKYDQPAASHRFVPGEAQQGCHPVPPGPYTRQAASPSRHGGGAQPQSAEGPGWTKLDSNLSSQIVAGLLIAGYALAMIAASLAVIMLIPSASLLLWPVMAIGVIVAMIAYHKGRPPLLWFMYGSVLPIAPLVHAALMGKVGAMASGGMQGQGALGLGALSQALASPPQASSGTGMDLFALVCILGAVPLVHALLAPQDPATFEARQLAAGMKKCASCAELVRQDAKVCHYCGNDLSAEKAA